MDIELILNDALNKAMCQKDRIQNPNSNTISEFVTKYLQDKKLTLTDVGKQRELLETVINELDMQVGTNYSADENLLKTIESSL